MIGYVLKLIPFVKRYWPWLFVVMIVFLSLRAGVLYRKLIISQVEVSKMSVRIAELEGALSLQASYVESLNRELEEQQKRSADARKRGLEAISRAEKKSTGILTREEKKDSLKMALRGLFEDLETMDWRKP